MAAVTLKALSAYVGLTDGTVSRALNDYPDISANTRARVKAAAEELGYRANSSARRLATGDAECIGYVLPWQSGQLSEPFLAELLDGLTSVISKRHWDLTLSVARSPEDELAIIKRLAQTRRINGLVISRTRIEDPRVDLMKSLDIPFVTHGRTGDSDMHAWFDVDNALAVNDAVAHLVALGHRKIAHIYGPQDFNFARARLGGFNEGLSSAEIAPLKKYLQESSMTFEGGQKAMKKLLSLKTPPTSVVCVSDMVALGAMRAIREFGWTPGLEVSVIGYDGLPLGEHTSPALTTMTQPLLDAGKRLGEMLIAVIDGDEPKHHQILVRAALLRRESDGPPLEARPDPS